MPSRSCLEDGRTYRYPTPTPPTPPTPQSLHSELPSILHSSVHSCNQNAPRALLYPSSTLNQAVSKHPLSPPTPSTPPPTPLPVVQPVPTVTAQPAMPNLPHCCPTCASHRIATHPAPTIAQLRLRLTLPLSRACWQC
ncbi:hypothetical protein B0H12DRAFT_1100552 [Mycena haematopus]|nr:hypothetical protein B0H12DRAFT_1100552 [Mycena haematopus]